MCFRRESDLNYIVTNIMLQIKRQNMSRSCLNISDTTPNKYKMRYFSNEQLDIVCITGLSIEFT